MEQGAAVRLLEGGVKHVVGFGGRRLRRLLRLLSVGGLAPPGPLGGRHFGLWAGGLVSLQVNSAECED